MQSTVVMAFRKRAKKLGYRDIHIQKISTTLYRVSAVEPLGGNRIMIDYTECEMCNALHYKKYTVSCVKDKQITLDDVLTENKGILTNWYPIE